MELLTRRNPSAPAHRGVTRFPPRRILVPLDLSAESMAGWEQARAVAGWFDADLEAAYVQPWVYSAMGIGRAEPCLPDRALKGAVEELRRRLGPGPVIHSATGAVSDGILSWAAEGFDLVVMATHGRTGLARAVSGSVAEYVVRHSPVPVLVVRRKVSKIRGVLAPVSLEADGWGAFLAAAHVAERLGAPLRALHVVAGVLPGHDEAAELNARLESWASRLPARIGKACRPACELAFGAVGEQVCLAARPDELIVLAAHRKGLLKEIVLGTTAERVLRHSAAPVLAIPL